MGEVAVQLFTDFPELFAARRRLFLLDASGSRRELHLENFWPHKEWMVLKFEGIDSINDAEPLIGGEIQIPQQERAQLDKGSAYVGDLIGCRVWVSRAESQASLLEIGVVSDVTFGSGEAPILEIKQGKKEHLVPLAQEYIKSLDTAARRIEMELPEGMLELDAPLSSEEKRAQQNLEEGDQ